MLKIFDVWPSVTTGDPWWPWVTSGGAINGWIRFPVQFPSIWYVIWPILKIFDFWPSLTPGDLGWPLVVLKMFALDSPCNFLPFGRSFDLFWKFSIFDLRWPLVTLGDLGWCQTCLHSTQRAISFHLVGHLTYFENVRFLTFGDP